MPGRFGVFPFVVQLRRTRRVLITGKRAVSLSCHVDLKEGTCKILRAHLLARVPFSPNFLDSKEKGPNSVKRNTWEARGAPGAPLGTRAEETSPNRCWRTLEDTRGVLAAQGEAVEPRSEVVAAPDVIVFPLFPFRRLFWLNAVGGSHREEGTEGPIHG